MKKTILLLLSFFVVISCSDNQEVSEPAAQHSTARIIPEADLKVLYDNMVNSTEYKDFELALDQFLHKMNYTGDGSDFDINGGMDWIASNLSQTQFTSFTEAENENENLAILIGIVANNNEEFFSAFGDIGNHPTINIIMSPPIATNEDPCGCIGAFNTCNTGVDNEYDKAMDIAEAAKPTISRKAYEKALSDAKKKQKFGHGICRMAKDYCIGACNE